MKRDYTNSGRGCLAVILISVVIFALCIYTLLDA